MPPVLLDGRPFAWIALGALVSCASAPPAPPPRVTRAAEPEVPRRRPPQMPEPRASYTAAHARAPLALRPLAPLSGARVRSRRPWLRWEMSPETVSSAEVELCAARDCRRVLQTFRSPRGQGAPPRDLPVGRVYWRVRAGEQTSATWRLDVRPARDVADAGHGTPGDLTGDGSADLFIADAQPPPAPEEARLFRGSAAGGLDLTPTSMIGRGVPRPGLMQSRRLPRGDVDGNGFDDVFSDERVHLGSRQGLGRWVVVQDEGARLTVVADVNGDGHDDVIRAQPTFDTSVEPAAGRLAVHLGEAGGVSASASMTIQPPAAEVRLFGVELARAGDVDGDGFDDVLAVGEVTAVSPRSFRIVLLRGSARGLTWEARRDLSSPAGASASWVAGWVMTEGLGDRDGDGIDDFAVLVGADDGVRLVEWRGRATGAPVAGEPEVVAPGSGITSGSDLTGDGLSDLVLVSATGVVVRPGGGGAEQTVSLPGRCAAVPGDLDADGYADLAVAVEGREVRIYYGGAGALFPERPVTVLYGADPASHFGLWVE